MATSYCRFWIPQSQRLRKQVSLSAKDLMQCLSCGNWFTVGGVFLEKFRFPMLKIPTFWGFHGPFSPILHCYASDLRHTSIHLSTWHRCMAPRRFWSLSQACSVSWRFRFLDLDYMFTAAAGCWVKPWGMLGETPGTSREREIRCSDCSGAAGLMHGMSLMLENSTSGHGQHRYVHGRKQVMWFSNCCSTHP